MSTLSLAILLPAIVGGVILVGRDVLVGPRAALAGLGVSLVSLVMLVSVWLRRGGEAFAGEADVRWTGALDVHWHVGIDGISYPLALMTVVLSALACWSLVDDAPEGDNTPGVLVALVLVIETASLGVFTALDLLLFFVFFELALIPMWFVIARWGDPQDPDGRRRAATRFLLFTVLGSAVMLVGFVVVWLSAGTLQIPELAARAEPLTGGTVLLGATAIAIGLAVKTPVWPLHIWLPDAHAKAPTVGSVLLAGVFLKLGTYGFLRVLLAILPGPSADLAPWLGVLGVFGILYASVACLRQPDLKRLIAYSSVGHMGFVVLGIATMSDIGITAAVFGSVAHGLITGLLFFNAGSFKTRFGSARFAVLGRGMYERVPHLSVVFAYAAIASLGLPGLAGFWGEMLALRSAYDAGSVLARPLSVTLLAFGALGVVLTSGYVVRMLRMLLQGVPTPQPGDADLTGSERGVSAVLVVLVLVLGLAPGLLTGLVASSVSAITGGAR